MVYKVTALAVLGAGLWFAGAAPAVAQQADLNTLTWSSSMEKS
jgi:hypothetical protein